MTDARYGGFTLRVDCRSCGQPIPVNAPEASVHCDHCQSDGELPGDLWRAVLRDFDENHDSFAAARAASKTEGVGGWIVHVARRRTTPACEKCKAPYPADRISDHSARDFFCVSCGDPGSTYPRPVWLSAHARTAVQIILTEPRAPGAGMSGNAVAVPDATRPVFMTCPGCGAPLSITLASSRTVRCEHCHVDVYLPDDLWRRLHPAKTMREWFVRFEGTTDTQRAEEERRRAQMADDADREQRRVQDREASARRDAEARVRAEVDAQAHDEAVQRAKRNAYFGLLPLYTTIGAVVAMFVAGTALDVELRLPSAVVGVVLGFQLGFAGLAAFMTATPIQKALRADRDQMQGYHWIWVIFSLFLFPFGPIVFVVGLKRFFGGFSASTLRNSSGYHHVKTANLSQRESWPAALFFLAMSLGVASEVGAGIVYGQQQSQKSREAPARRAATRVPR